MFYSVFGIKSKKRDIVLVNAVFRENGQFNFTINDNIMMVDEKISVVVAIPTQYRHLLLAAKRRMAPWKQSPVCNTVYPAQCRYPLN